MHQRFTLALVLLIFGYSFANAQEQKASVQAQLIPHFELSDPQKTEFGSFEFVGGLVLRSQNPHFGAISGMRIQGSDNIVAVADTGFWFQGKIERDDKLKPVGISGGTIAPALGVDGRPFQLKWQSDLEGLTFSNGIAFASAEMDMRVLSFGRREDLSKTPSTRLTKPFSEADFDIGFSFEAIATLPVGHAIYPGLIVFTENDPNKRGKAPAFLLKDGELQELAVQQKDGFFITDADFLPSGDLLILERKYSLVRGAGIRIRRIKGTDIAPNALLDGQILMEASERHVIDNMEAISVLSASDGSTRIAIMSDNNHWLMQRTLYLEFKLSE